MSDSTLTGNISIIYTATNMNKLTNITELTEMIGISISDSEACKEDIENLEVDFQKKYIKDISYDDLSDENKNMFTNIKNDMLFFRKRTFIKTIFSNIEGILYATKQIILENRDRIDNDKDIINLQEKRYEGSSKDKLKEIVVYPNFLDNIKLVFKYYKILYSPNYNLNNFYTELDKQNFVKDIRNNVTHPKQMAYLKVTDEELENCKYFDTWFYREYSKLLENES
jgi:hypothetical protein